MPIKPSAGLALAFLAGGALAAVPVQAQTLDLGHYGATLSGIGTLTNAGTNASGTYKFYDAGDNPAPLDPTATTYDYLIAYGPSTANVKGGTVGDLFPFDTSTANVSGGTVSSLNTSGASTANVTGGSIGAISTDGTSTLDLFGTGFSEMFVGTGPGYTEFDVTGTLQNGAPINATYYDYSGKLEFNVPEAVPEASSVISFGLLLLLGLGGVAMSRRRKARGERE